MDLRGQNLRELLLRQMMGISNISRAHCYQVMVNEMKDGVDPLTPGPQKAGLLYSLARGHHVMRRIRNDNDLILSYYIMMAGYYAEKARIGIPEMVGHLWNCFGYWKQRGHEFVLGIGGLLPLVPRGAWDEEAWFRHVAAACEEARDERIALREGIYTEFEPLAW